MEKFFLLALLFGAACAFMGPRWMHRSSTPIASLTQSQHKIVTFNYNSFSLHAVKPDLFSDDLFEEDNNRASKDGNSKEIGNSQDKRKYLDQQWQLSPEDAKDFKGFTKSKIPEIPEGEVPNYPCFALIYKFRREFFDANMEATMSDHRGHSSKFKRLINTESLRLKSSRGVVLLWVGLSADDKAATREDIMKFMEEDPLILKDFVEKWDVIDLEQQSKNDLPKTNSVNA